MQTMEMELLPTQPQDLSGKNAVQDWGLLSGIVVRGVSALTLGQVLFLIVRDLL